MDTETRRSRSDKGTKVPAVTEQNAPYRPAPGCRIFDSGLLDSPGLSIWAGQAAASDSVGAYQSDRRLHLMQCRRPHPSRSEV